MATTVKRKIVKRRPVKAAESSKSVKPAAKKAPVKKTAAKRPVAKKVTPKKVTKTPAKGTARRPAKKTGSTTARKSTGRVFNMNPHGFTVGSDQAIIVDAMVAGGADRVDVANKALKKLPEKTTRDGNEKNVSSLMSALIKRLLGEGYKIESNWRLVPPARVQKKLEKA
jgi:hypothetical protein